MRGFASISWKTRYQGPVHHKLLAWIFSPDHTDCMNLGFKAIGEPGYGYKFSLQIFPFSFSSQVNHWKFSLDFPEGWKVSIEPTHWELALWGLSSVWSGLLLDSPSCANLTFSPLPCTTWGNEKPKVHVHGVWQIFSVLLSLQVQSL